MGSESREAGSQRPALLRIPAIALILILFLALGVTYSVINPIFEAPDELQHFFYAVHLAEGRGFPPQGLTGPDALWEQEASQPPLYYLAAALVIAPADTYDAASLAWLNEHAYLGDPLRPGNKNRVVHTEAEAWPYRGAVLAVHLARWLSLALAAGTVFLVHRIVRELLPAAPALANAAAAVTAFTPQFIFVSSAISNDNLIILLATLTAWLLVRGLRGRRPRAWPVVLGVALGLAGLAKLSGLLLWPWVAAAIIAQAAARRSSDQSGRSWRCIAADLAVIFGVALAVAGGWYLRNWLLYDDPTGLGAMLDVVGRRPQLLGWRGLISQFEGLRISYWALFGWFNVPLPAWLYRVLDVLGIVACAGLLLAGLDSLRRDRSAGGAGWAPGRDDQRWLLLPASWLLLLVASLAQWTSITPGSQGRLLYPAAWAINLLLILGWSRWALLPARLRNLGKLRLSQRRSSATVSEGDSRPGGWASRVWLALPAGLLAATAVCAPAAFMAPAYARPQLTTADAVPAGLRLPPVTHGALARRLAASIEPATVRPGEDLWVTIYWEVLAPGDRDYTVFVHLLPAGQGGASVAEANSWPGLGAYPTRVWQAGTVVVDRYPVHIPGGAAAPVLLSADTGFFVYGSREQIPSFGPDGTPAADVIGSVRVLPAAPPVVAPGVTAGARFGEEISLLGYDPPAGPVAAGTSFSLVLYWQAERRPSADYTVFLHLRSVDGRNVAGADGVPLAGTWPTSAWEPGYPVTDARAVSVPEGTPPGRYELWVGLYRAEDAMRLPVEGAMSASRDGALYLGEVAVAHE